MGPAGFPADALSFRVHPFSDPEGSDTFGAMKWRLADVTQSAVPPFRPTGPLGYEIESTWQSEVIEFSKVCLRVRHPNSVLYG